MGLSFCSYTSLNLVFWFSLFHLTLSHFVASRPPLCHHDERSALLQFKESLFIKRARDVSAYSSAYPKVSSWKAEENGDCCYWDGITCNEDTGHVVSLNLTSSYLYGSINSSSSLFHLVHLEWLSLADNNFNDSKIPSRIMNLSRLTHLDLSYSIFSGQIPSEILELSNLVFLNISYNHLEHQYWSDLLGSLAGALTNLKMPDLSEVNISSSVPHTLTNLSSLTYLSLEKCELQGEFPSEIFRLPYLHYLSVSENPDLIINLPEFEKNSSLEELKLARTRVIGGIPNSLGNLKSLSFSGYKFLEKLHVNSSSLTYLSIEDCEMQGEFPSEIFQLPNLRYLSVSANLNLTINLPEFEKKSPLEELRLAGMRVIGGIPYSLGNLKSLSYMDFSDCTFLGKLQVNSSSLTYLSLNDCELQGEFPSEIFWLPNLRYLSVSGNPNLTIYLPKFGKNSPLEKLILAGTQVSGGIPNSLGNLKSLSYMDFSGCNFSGKLWVNSSSLTYLSLEYCELQGEFPSEIFQLPNLRYLSVFGNPNLTIYLPEFGKNSPLEKLILAGTKVSGGIPNSLGNLKSLSYMDFSGCKFSRKLQVNSSSLTYLSLENCKLQGEFPSLGNLKSLSYLDISNNYLSGPIPSSIVNLTRISYLDLSSNDISGQIPSSIVNLTRISYLDLSSNEISGELPSFIGNLGSLKQLHLSYNKLTGHIPFEIKNLTQLNCLDLGSNRLAGQVSSSLFELKNLQLLELSSNNLSGTLDINKFFFNFKNLEMIDLSSNNLSLLTEDLVSNYSQNLFFVRLSSCNLNLFPNFLQKQDQLEFLDLSSNKIAGHIPRWLLNVSIFWLEYLNLSNNLFEGFDQHLIVLPWTNLGILDLSSNKLQGPLPIPSNSTFSFLVSYLVSKNHLTGKFPRWICSLSYLNALDLSYNNLSGVLPKCLRNFTDQLSILKLQSNRFYGSIPEIFMNGSNLMMIDLSHNLFRGRIPKSLANCTKLEFINVGNNQIDDIFPSWLGFLPELKILLLQWNRLYGTIKEPKTDFEFPKLHIIDLSHNRFKGSLPSKYFQCWNSMKVVNTSQLEYLRYELEESQYFIGDTRVFTDCSVTLSNKGIQMNYEKLPKFFTAILLSDNKFEGEIPASVGDLKGLHSLNISNNNLQGRIPLSFGNLTSLESLDLSHNRLSGEIPHQLVEITSLEVFDVSHNHLTGPIPEGKQFNTFDNTSYDGNPRLCGKPLSKKCENPEPSQKDDEVSSSSFSFGWKIVAIGYASGLVIGLVLGHFFTERKHEWFAKTFGWQLKTTGRQTRNRRSL